MNFQIQNNLQMFAIMFNFIKIWVSKAYKKNCDHEFSIFLIA